MYFRLRSLYFSFENFEIRFLDSREIPIFLINLSKGFYITIILLYYYNNARDICEIIMEKKILENRDKIVTINLYFNLYFNIQELK